MYFLFFCLKFDKILQVVNKKLHDNYNKQQINFLSLFHLFYCNLTLRLAKFQGV